VSQAKKYFVETSAGLFEAVDRLVHDVHPGYVVEALLVPAGRLSHEDEFIFEQRALEEGRDEVVAARVKAFVRADCHVRENAD
jgi:hypothetical protein